jgi:hypothetical protein
MNHVNTRHRSTGAVIINGVNNQRHRASVCGKLRRFRLFSAVSKRHSRERLEDTSDTARGYPDLQRSIALLGGGQRVSPA